MRIPGLPVNPPDTDSLKVGLPAFGRITTSLADAVNQQLGSRGMRRTLWTCSLDVATSQTPPASATIRMLHRVSPLGEWLALLFHYAADDYSTAPGGAVVSAYTYTPTGVLIDGPVTWSIATGTLDGSTVPRAGGPAPAFGRLRGQDRLARPRWVTGTGTTPRLLSLGANQGLDVEIRLVLTSTVVYDVSATDAFFPEI